MPTTRKQMEQDIAALLPDDDYKDALAEHPRPWRIEVVRHDGFRYQYFDANGNPCLPGFIDDAEAAVTILHAINSIA